MEEVAAAGAEDAEGEFIIFFGLPYVFPNSTFVASLSEHTYVF